MQRPYNTIKGLWPESFICSIEITNDANIYDGLLFTSCEERRLTKWLRKICVMENQRIIGADGALALILIYQRLPQARQYATDHNYLSASACD